MCVYVYICIYIHICVYIYTVCVCKYVIYIFKWSLTRELNTTATDIKVSANIPIGFKAGINMRLGQALL